MTHFSDGLAVGGAITNQRVGSQGGFGVKASQSVTYDIVPLTKNAAAYAASQSPGAGAIVLSAGTGVTAQVVNGVNLSVADGPRAVTVTSGGNDTGITFAISGFDYYGAAMTQTLTGASGAAATTTKAFASVVSVVPSGAVATTVTVGTADVFGVPVAVSDIGYVSAAGWASVLGFDAGTFVVAVATSPATALTGDVRGTYTPSSASNGSRRLVLDILLSAAQTIAAPSATSATAILGVTQA